MPNPKFWMDGKDLVVKTTQDVEDIIEWNKILRTVSQKSDWGRHVACIPLEIINQWLEEESKRGNVTLRLNGPGFNEMVEKKLRDHDWLFLRTDAPGDQVGWQRLIPK